MSIPEPLWTSLVDKVVRREVIPVLGSQLVEVEVEGVKASVESHLAQRLAAKLGYPSLENSTRSSTLFEVVARARSENRSRELHHTVFDLVEELGEKVEPPPHLLSLAKIEDFRIYLTLSFDNLLVQALEDHGWSVDERAYNPSSNWSSDLEKKVDDRIKTVFYLFGKGNGVKDFVIGENDLLEWVSSLQNPNLHAVNLRRALSSNHLLLLGCEMPDWVLRLFIRATRGEKISSAKGPEILIGAHKRRHPKLVKFLNIHSPETQVLNVEPLTFISELLRRWQEKTLQVSSFHPDVDRDLPRGGVFLSYASNDRDVAIALYSKLKLEIKDVWLDESRIISGDHISSVIRRNIGRCGVFVQLVSAKALDRLKKWNDQEGRNEARKPYFLQELEAARNHIDAGLIEIFPVKIDTAVIDFNDQIIPDEWSQFRLWEDHAGIANEELILKIRNLVRDVRRKLKAGQ